LVLGAITRGGGGCACPENTFIRTLINDLVLYKDEALVMDMEAGIEHLGRATATGVDVMVIVVEPGRRAVDCAGAVIRLSREIGLNSFLIIGNKVRDEEDRQFIAGAFPEMEVAAFLPYSEEIRAADRDGISVLSGMKPGERAVIEGIVDQIWKSEKS
ncbi:MAG: carbon monoxide dehydrogenase, partial [Clostridia bacterium]|nr:carbon monoxide dehydrogenase [Clostridia bacterium]